MRTLKTRRRVGIASAFAAVAAIAVAVLLSGQGGDATATGDLEALLDANKPIDQVLTAAGFPDQFVKIFSSVTTEVVSSTPNRYHFVQRIPALSMRRDTRIAIHPDKQLQPRANKAVRTAAGFDIYALHHAVVGFPGGYDRYQAFFVAYEALGPDLIDRLGLQRRAAQRRGWNILPVAHAQSALLGIVVASVATTTGSSGLGDTFVPAPPPGIEFAETNPGAPPINRPTADPTLAEIRQMYLDENFNGSQEAYNQQHQETHRRWVESLDAEARAHNESLQLLDRRTDAYLRGEIELANLLREGETLDQQIARVKLERDAARLQRVGHSLSVLQALAEWMQQALDFGEWNRQLAAAEACLDQRAQNAGPEERANIEQVRAHLQAARSDMNWNTGVRVVNSGNSVAGSAVPAGAIVGGVFGLASSGNNAQLRDLTAQSVADALRGVGNCDPPPCPEPSSKQPPTQELLYTPGNQQTFTPGPERQPPPDSRCGPPRAVIVMKLTEKTPVSNHTATFTAVVDLSNIRRVQVGGTTLEQPESNFNGTGRAAYHEHLDQVVEDHLGKRCEYSLTRSGQPKAEVIVQASNREVSVTLVGPLQDGEQDACKLNAAPSPIRECYFFDVDVDRGGVFKADDGTDFNNGADDFKNFECTLTLTPLRGKSGRGLTSAPVPGADPRRR